MLIAIGTTNTVKIQAAEETFQNYPMLAHAKLRSFSVESDVADQPLSLEETIKGAKNRARKAFEACNGCNYSFGIESGLFEALGTQTGFLEATICCIYDGMNYHTGLSCGFEPPPQILKLVLENKRDLGQACYESGITANAKLGSAEGLVGILSKGRLTRKEYTKQSIITALIQIENPSWYDSIDAANIISNF